MGNIQNTINSYMMQLDELIKNENFDEAKRKFIKYQNELKKTSSEEKKQEMINILIEFLKPETKNVLKNYIYNLISEDRIYLIFKEIYEEKLIDSCDFEKSQITAEKDIKEYIEKTEKVFKMVGLVSKTSVVNERLSLLYFKLANIKFNNLPRNRKLKQVEEIIDLEEKSLQYIKQTINNEQRVECEKMLEELLNIKYELIAVDKMIEKKYDEAIEFFKKVTKENENVLNCIEKCYEEIMMENEKNKNYEKALEALEHLHNNVHRIKEKRVELRMKLIYQKIENKLKGKNYSSVLDLYYDLLEFKIDEGLSEKYFEQDFEKYNELFISNLISITLDSYKENKLSDFLKKLEEKSTKFKKEKVLFYLKDLLKNLKQIQKDKNILSFDNIINILLSQSQLSEIKQRIFLIFLVEYYLNKENKQKILEALNNSKVDFIYLTTEGKNILYNLLKDEDLNNTDMIFLISKIIYKITIKEIEPSKELYKITGLKIQKSYKHKASHKNLTFYDSVKELMKIFQNIILKSSYGLKEPIIIYTNILFGLEQLRKEAIKGLVAFVQYRDNEILANDIIYFFIDYILSKNEEINNLLETILQQIKLQKNIEKGIVLLLLKLLIFYKREKNDLSSQEKIIKLLIEENIDKKVLIDFQVIKNINEYLKLGNSSKLIFDFIYIHNKIPEEHRTYDMNEAYNNYLEKKDVKKGNQKKEEVKLVPYQLINILKLSNNINEENQSQIEDILDDSDTAKYYLNRLKSSDSLYKTMNLKKVSSHIYKHTFELFEFVCERKREWPEKALLNLLNGFYKGDDNDNDFYIKETFKIFRLIKEYQKDIPEIIIKNLEIEEKLSKPLYYKLENDDFRTYEEMIKDFNDLHGFSIRHKKFISQFNKFSFNINHNIYADFINLIANKNFDIGKNIFTKSIQRVKLDFFINIYPKIISNTSVNITYKSLTLQRLNKELNSQANTKEQITQLINHIKYFIDWIILPPKVITTFYNLLKKYFDDVNIKKELTFSFGNYFSFNKETQKDSFIKVKDLIINDPIYQKLINMKLNKFKDEELFYIYSSAQYYDKDDFANPDILPMNIIAKFIFEHQHFYEYKEIVEKIEKFSERLKFGKFSTERDVSLSHLFLCQEPKLLDYLEIINI